jgi:S-layer like family, outer domain
LSLTKKFVSVDSDAIKESCTIYAPYIKVSSGQSGAVFELDATEFTPGTTMSNNEFFVATNFNILGNPSAECAYSDGSGTWNPVEGTVFMKLSPSSGDYDYAAYVSPGTEVKYSAIGDGSDKFSPPDGGAIVLQRAVDVGVGDEWVGSLLNSIDGTYAGTILAGSTPPDFVFGLAEKAGTGSANDYVDYFVFGARNLGGAPTLTPSDALFQFNSDWTDTPNIQVFSDNSKVLYGHATRNPAAGAPNTCGFMGLGLGTDYYCAGATYVSGPVNSKLELVEEGYVSERGSKFKSIDDRNVQFDMAHKLAKAQWFIQPASTNTTSADKTIVTLGEGESKTVSGVTVKVLEITEDVGACSATGGSASCTADMSGVSAVIMPNNAASVAVAMPYTGSYGNLVILDSDAVGVNTLVSVGGDVVNSVTADLLQGSAVDWTATTKVVKEVVQGSKIVVAGAQKEDTLAAAQDFVSQVKRT